MVVHDHQASEQRLQLDSLLSELPKFIETERTGGAGEEAELRVWAAVKRAFRGRACLAYWHYPIFPKHGVRREPDILIFDQEFGIVIIEVKGHYLEQITSIEGDRWTLQGSYKETLYPYRQASQQLQTLLNFCEAEPSLQGRIPAKVLIGLPNVSTEEWLERGYYHLPSAPPVICDDNLGASSLLATIRDASPYIDRQPLADAAFYLLLRIVNRGHPPAATKPLSNYQGRGQTLVKARDMLERLDLQQEMIAKQIPPGPQRIRGVAGSGKTVLLCQKAAQMHLKHPAWDIALVFNTRSLYDLVQKNLDRWLKHFTHGELGYDSANSKLKVLHAWGAKDQPGFYRSIAQAHGVRAKSFGDLRHIEPSRRYPYVLKEFLEQLAAANQPIQPQFDAILVDEGQDLVFDEAFKFQGKQPFYWLAYQSLRPSKLAAEAQALFEAAAAAPETADQRRLIWAYDEAQSLTSLVIPSYREIFGEAVSQTMLSGGVSYPGNIAKHEVMHRCYRTPASTLMAAHAMGMGLLRPEGILTGLSSKEDWQKLGYQVEGDFRKVGNTISIRRSPDSSPNPVKKLYPQGILTFQAFNSRQDEIDTAVSMIAQDLEEGLEASRDIMVVVFHGHERNGLVELLARALAEQNIAYFIPGAKRPNQLSPKYPDNDPNSFWHPGALTISDVYKAKGNEADVIYLLGLDAIAKRESDIKARNELFVALTRSRGWAHISGTGHYPLFEELKMVIRAGDELSFKYERSSRWQITDES